MRMVLIIDTRITRGARPALAALFRARQYPCSRFLVYDLAAHELVVPATMMMLQYSMGLLQQIVRPPNRKYACRGGF